MKKFLVLAAVALSCSGCLRENPLVPATGIPARMPDQEMRVFSDSEKAIIRRGVVASVPNPAFAEFRWGKLPKSTAEVEYYCGQLNAQTEPGRWVGFRPFIAVLEMRDDRVREARLIEISRDRIDVGSVLAKCREHGLDPFAAVEAEQGLSTEAQQRWR
jgi:hypothetical protein